MSLSEMGIRLLKKINLPWLLLLWSISLPAIAADTVTARRATDCSIASEASFTIAARQQIEWTARYNSLASPSCRGDAFFLSRTDSRTAEIRLTNTGETRGTRFLDAGTYHISIRNSAVGAGTYTVVYSRTASIEVSPKGHAFGELEIGESSRPERFTIRSTGDVTAVTVAGVNSSNPSHFEISGDPRGTMLDGRRRGSFDVIFHAGDSSGDFNAIITVSADSSLGRISAESTVSGTTRPRRLTMAILMAIGAAVLALFIYRLWRRRVPPIDTD